MRKTLVLLVIFSIPLMSFSEVIKKVERWDGGKLKVYKYYDGKKEIACRIIEASKIIRETGRIPDGAIKGYDKKGQLVSEEQYKHEKLNGICKYYYTNSKSLFWTSEYSNGVLNGITYFYKKNGKIEGKHTYKEGKLLNMETYYDNGNLNRKVDYKNDELEKDEIIFDKLGRLIEINHYYNGLRDGIQKIITKERNLIEKKYDKGKLVLMKVFKGEKELLFEKKYE